MMFLHSRAWCLVTAFFLGCGSGAGDDSSAPGPKDSETGQSAETGDVETGDVDTAKPDTGTPPDTGDPKKKKKEYGPLIIEQIHVTGDDIGEAALVIGPDGTTLLLDIGGESHAAEVLEAVDHHLPTRDVDWVLLTHWHRDHLGGFTSLFEASEVNDNDPIAVHERVVSRGRYDLNADTVHHSAYESTCQALYDDTWSDIRLDLCEGTEETACSLKGKDSPWASTGCSGLTLGDLATTADDDDGALSYIELGDGARLTMFWINGYLAVEDEIIAAADEGLAIHSRTNENTRSMVGMIRWGDFTYLFGGDLTGRSPDAESFIVDRADRLVLPSGEQAFPSGAIDVLHVNHHGHNTATEQTLLQWAMPDDGWDRNAVIGANRNYGPAVHQSVLDRLGEVIGNGAIWITEQGGSKSGHVSAKVMDAAVVLEVSDGGSAYELFSRQGETLSESQVYSSTPR